MDIDISLPTINAERERAADWATALVPTVIMAVLYYRWSAAALLVTAVAGVLAASRLLSWVLRRESPLQPWTAVVYGVLVACVLPATAPWWLSALMGGAVAALDAALPLARRVHIAIHPVLPVAVLVRAVFPSAFAAYTVPAQFVPVDGVSAATPLTMAVAGERLPEWWRLVFGVHAGAIGEGCAVAIVLGFAVLLLRRRARWVAPVCLVAAGMLLSWAVYGLWTVALAAPLMGGCLLGAWLLADDVYAPQTVPDQVIVGVVAGVVTVLVRRYSGWAEGVALGVLAGQLLVPVLPFVYRGMAAVRRRIGQLSKKEK